MPFEGSFVVELTLSFERENFLLFGAFLSYILLVMLRIVSTSPLLPLCPVQLFALPLEAGWHCLAQLAAEILFRISTLTPTSFIVCHLCWTQQKAWSELLPCAERNPALLQYGGRGVENNCACLSSPSGWNIGHVRVVCLVAGLQLVLVWLLCKARCDLCLSPNWVFGLLREVCN